MLKVVTRLMVQPGISNTPDKLPTPNTWAKAKFIATKRLLTTTPLPQGPRFAGLGLFLLLGWVSKQMTSSNISPDYALHHWDTRPANIKVNDQGKIVA
jgi:hypothetical protein